MPDLTFASLASSSKGNAYVVSDGETTLLLECGLTFKELQKRLGYHMADLTACLVSHEHQDHAKAAPQMLKRGVPMYMSYGTAISHKEPMDGVHLIKAGDRIPFGAMTVVPFRVFHNTEEPLGFLIEDGRTGERLLFAIDTANLHVVADRLTYIAVECNYEEALLSRSDRMLSLMKERVRRSHFEIDRVIRWLHKQDLSGVLTIYLLHLSAGHSRAAAWDARFRREFPGINIVICKE